VESEGVEPSSKQGIHKFSTCLLYIYFRGSPGIHKPRFTLILMNFALVLRSFPLLVSFSDVSVVKVRYQPPQETKAI
jgi:hypothetical protein